MAEIVATVGRITGIPEETLRGETGKVDFNAALAACVVGQLEAVSICARELSLIKSGMKDLERPASVMLFAGMTGTGKTELAKTIANMYSATKRLVVFTMGNFTEAHSISGIIGVPPGYVGHDLGGRLINEINKDPYCVILLDEIEKAHPEIWKPFLNLFDEGWIVDARNVRANASRCIFILTSNVGAEAASGLYEKNATNESIQEAVKEALYQHEFKPGLKSFTPEFLARIQQIVVFRPLDKGALGNIVHKQIEGKCATYGRLRSKKLSIRENVRKALTEECMARYRSSNGREGGRVVRKVISEYIDGALQELNSDKFQRAQEIFIDGLDLKKLDITLKSSGLTKEEAGLELNKILTRAKNAAMEKVSVWADEIESQCQPFLESTGSKSKVISKKQMQDIEKAFEKAIQESESAVKA